MQEPISHGICGVFNSPSKPSLTREVLTRRGVLINNYSSKWRCMAGEREREGGGQGEGVNYPGPGVLRGAGLRVCPK
jgi:hypothetical protein